MTDIIKHFLCEEIKVNDNFYVEVEYEIDYSVYDGDIEIFSLLVDGAKETDSDEHYRIKCKFETELYDNYKVYLDDKADTDDAIAEDYWYYQRELREED